MKFTKIYSLLLHSAALCSLLTGCASGSPDSPDIPDPGSSSGFSIFSRTALPSSGTRAEFPDPDITRNTEKIQSWIVVFIRHTAENKGTVAEVVKGGLTSPVMEDNFTPTKLTGTGTYDIVGFANFEETDAATALGFELTEGTEVDLSKLATLSNLTFNAANIPGTVGEYLVPMSGLRRNVEITDNFETSPGITGERNSIEVIRLFAKIDVQIRNTSSSSITVNSIKFGQLNKGEVPLFPDYTNLGADGKPSANPPAILSTQLDDYGKAKADCKERPEITVGSTIANTEDAVAKALFYVRESSAATTHTNERFYITVNYTRSSDPTKTVEEHYTSLDELQWIQRNDHIVIPITISESTIDWEVLFYPPIGGYPAVVKPQDGDEDSFIFMTPGKFSIRPMRKSGGVESPATGVDFKINGVTDTDGNSLLNADGTLKDGTIFKTLPKINDSGEIIGELGTDTGSAIIDCTITLTTPEGGKDTRTHKIYIHRQTSSTL